GGAEEGDEEHAHVAVAEQAHAQEVPRLVQQQHPDNQRQAAPVEDADEREGEQPQRQQQPEPGPRARAGLVARGQDGRGLGVQLLGPALEGRGVGRRLRGALLGRKVGHGARLGARGPNAPLNPTRRRRLCPGGGAGIMGAQGEGGTMSTVGRRRAGVSPRRWSKAEYYRLGELGFFQGQRVELIEGRIMVLSPQNPPHAGTLDAVAEVLRGLFGPGYRVRVQMPMDLGQTTEPEPDVAVVAGTVQQFLTAHPTSAALIVEVSDTKVSYDRKRKGSLYARAGIADYWIRN